jgi:hypothetical protein
VGLYGENLANSQGITFSSYSEWVKADTIIRPRTLTLKFSYKFSDKK